MAHARLATESSRATKLAGAAGVDVDRRLTNNRASRAGRVAVGAMIAAVAGVLAGATAERAEPVDSRAKLSRPNSASPTRPNGRTAGGSPELRSLRARVWLSGLTGEVATRRPTDPGRRTIPPTPGPRASTRRLHGREPLGSSRALCQRLSLVGERRPQSHVGPDAPGRYGDFMAAAVLRYPQVRRWIVFAEPSHYVNFRPQGGGGRRAPRPMPSSSTRVRRDARSPADVVVVGGNVHPAKTRTTTTTA